jgi:hypothetical protein
VHGEPSPRFYVDERPLPSENVYIRPDHVELRVDVPESPSPLRLGWVSAAHRAAGDDRALGLPVVSVVWIRESSSTNHADERAQLRLAAPSRRLT